MHLVWLRHCPLCLVSQPPPASTSARELNVLNALVMPRCGLRSGSRTLSSGGLRTVLNSDIRQRARAKRRVMEVRLSGRLNVHPVAQIGLTGQREFGSLWSIICTCVDYAFRPQRYLDESVMQWPRGKVLGGSRYVRSS